jgi:hypothetical protein
VPVTIILMVFRIAVCLLCFAAVAPAGATSPFDGIWVYRYDGQNYMKFEIAASGNTGTAVVTHPQGMAFTEDGAISAGSAEYVAEKPAPFTIEAETLKFANGAVITRMDETHATLTLAPQIRPLQLIRMPDGEPIEMAKPRDWPPEIQSLRRELAALVKDDQDARTAFDEKRTITADAHAHAEVIRILDRYGWVTKSLAGSDAAHDFWLLVQHQDLPIQQRGVAAMKKAADAGDASMTEYAYLYDRVQTRMGKPQHWGTQTQCTASGPIATEVDDPAGLDARRAELGLTPESDYLKSEFLVRSCAQSR